MVVTDSEILKPLVIADSSVKTPSPPAVEKTPLQLLAQACDNIGPPGLATRSQTIRPLDTPPMESKPKPRMKEICRKEVDRPSPPMRSPPQQTMMSPVLPSPFMAPGACNPYASMMAFPPSSTCLPPSLIAPCRDQRCRSCVPGVPHSQNPRCFNSVPCAPSMTDSLWLMNQMNHYASLSQLASLSRLPTQMVSPIPPVADLPKPPTISVETQPGSVTADSSHICHWEINKDQICGKKFDSSAQLCDHFQAEHAQSKATATNPVATPTSSATTKISSPSQENKAAQSYLNSIAAAARYHPYAKPSLPNPMASMPFSPLYAFNPLPLPYGPRLAGSFLT